MLCPGTVSYCAPELLKEGKLTKAADVYSFDMIMWEMYSSTALFRGMNSSQVGILISLLQRRWWGNQFQQYLHMLA